MPIFVNIGSKQISTTPLAQPTPNPNPGHPQHPPTYSKKAPETALVLVPLELLVYGVGEECSCCPVNGRCSGNATFQTGE